MSENLRNYTKAVYAFERALKNGLDKSGEKLFAKKAPCAGWTGKDVYEHGLGNLKMIHAFATTGNGPKSTPKLGKHPLGAWEKLRDQTLESLDHEGVLHSIANDPFGPELGPLPMDVLVGFMAAELAVHVWDLARTARVDERLDPALVKFTNATWRSLGDDILRGPGMMGPKVPSERGADAQTKLLNFLGRAV
jgi:uncharacterized protein (TIGR03086 family)